MSQPGLRGSCLVFTLSLPRTAAKMSSVSLSRPPRIGFSISGLVCVSPGYLLLFLRRVNTNKFSTVVASTVLQKHLSLTSAPASSRAAANCSALESGAHVSRVPCSNSTCGSRDPHCTPWQPTDAFQQ